MAKSTAELQAELVTLNAAIQTMVAGDRLTELRVGSGEFARVYRFSEITLEGLKALRDEAQAELDAVSDVTPNFVSGRAVPLLVGKDIY